MYDMASVFRNNMILPRKDQPLKYNMLTIFDEPGIGDAIVNIDGYAIIPMDLYKALTAQLTRHQLDQLMQTLTSQQGPEITIYTTGSYDKSSSLRDRTSNVSLERSA